MFELLSFLWYWLFRIDPGQWLLALGMGWWGFIKYAHSDTSSAYLWWTLTVVLLLLSVSGRVFGYVIFRATDEEWRSLGGRIGNVEVLAAGDFFRSIEPDLNLWAPRTYVNQPVVLRQQPGRPPALVASGPPKYVLKGGAPDYSSTWYPGSAVRRGTVYMGGRAQPGLELSFVGRRLLLGFDNEEDAAALAALLESLENGRTAT